MKKHKLFTLILLLISVGSLQAKTDIIPKPNEIKITDGKFNYAKGFDVKIVRGDYATQEIHKEFSAFVQSKKIQIVRFSKTAISFNLLKTDVDTFPADAYKMSITPTTIEISSTSNAGLFYGMQSLMQLFNVDTTHSLSCFETNDVPAFAYRGFQLDAAHRFISVAHIMHLIDVMAKLKLNNFHWQLADEKNWHIALASETSLTSKENFYTKDDITTIVQYAQKKFIQVIPELNFALLANQDSSKFATDKIVNEICSLFPGNYIHLGNNSINANFYQKIQALLKLNNKEIIVRDQAQFANSTLQVYSNNKGITSSTANGKNIIMSPSNYCSLDFQQDWDDEKYAFYMSYLPLDKAYSFNPTSKIKDKATAQHIIGAEACMPTMYIKDSTTLEYMLFPRLIALAECMWTNKRQKKYSDFQTRLSAQNNYFFTEKEFIYDLVHINPKKMKNKQKKKKK